METCIPVSFPKNHWEEVSLILESKGLDLLSQASNSDGLYKEILTYEADICLSLVQEIKVELGCSIYEE